MRGIPSRSECGCGDTASLSVKQDEVPAQELARRYNSLIVCSTIFINLLIVQVYLGRKVGWISCDVVLRTQDSPWAAKSLGSKEEFSSQS